MRIKNDITALAVLSLCLTSLTASAGHHSDENCSENCGKKGHKVIEKFDANKDGQLSREEFTAYTMAKFDKMDANKDGQISQEEYAAHHKAKKQKRHEKREMRKNMNNEM